MPEADDKLRRLLDVGTSLVRELDPDTVFQRILEEARALTGARYAALGVLDESRRQLERFLTLGVDEATHRAIGDLPRGRGVLGVLIEEPRLLRMTEVSEHPHSYGFPAGHPPMHSFLGVPIVIRGEAWGNLYLAEKQPDGAFTDEDAEAAVVLAQWAATAIGNARLFAGSEERRERLERAVRSLQAARDIADAISGMPELDRVLELIVKRGRALVSAQTVLILLREGDHLRVAASAGLATDACGRRIPVSGSTSGRILERGRAERIDDVGSRLRIAPEHLGVENARAALLVPMLHRGAGLGILAAFDRGAECAAFTAEDEQRLRTFAASAANAVAINQSVEAERLRSMVAGIRRAIADIELEIGNLRGIITDLRPSILDDLGLRPALEALLDRRRTAGLDIVSDLALPDSRTDGFELGPALEMTVYRIVQEALTNVAKHARAKSARVSVGASGEDLGIEVTDDGVGFDIDARTAGFGLKAMRERAYLAGGTLEVQSDSQGTSVRVRLPLADRSAAPPRSLHHVTS